MASSAFFSLMLLAIPAWASAKIGSFAGRIDPGGVTVSGLSSGAAFATQFHVAFSSTVSGAGVIAGVPYYCAQGNVLLVTYCMTLPSFVSVSDMISNAEAFARSGKIDDLANLEDDRVFIYHSTGDLVVSHASGVLVQDFYRSFMPRSGIMLEDGIASSHGMPAMDYGDPCYSLLTSTYILDCDYDGAFETLDFLYGGGLNPAISSGSVGGQLTTFDQGQFVTGSPSSISMADEGYLFVPSGCAGDDSTCRLHVAFHGCRQGSDSVGDVYARHAGYLETAEANDIVVIFPQVKASLLSPQNPMGCWDWWGYDDGLFADEYATKSGPQMEAVHNMIQNLLV